MTHRDRLRARIAGSTDRQVETAALLLLVSVAAIDVILMAGAAWTAHAVLDRTHGFARIVGLGMAAVVLSAALASIWQITRGYRNLRRVIDDARNAR